MAFSEYLNFSISTPSENILPFYAVEAALLPCGGQLIAKVNEVDTLFSPGELILLARLHQHTSFHFLFKIEIFFHTTYILHSPLPMDVALTSYQPFHKIQNHEQDLNIFRQIINKCELQQSPCGSAARAVELHNKISAKVLKLRAPTDVTAPATCISF